MKQLVLFGVFIYLHLQLADAKPETGKACFFVVGHKAVYSGLKRTTNSGLLCQRWDKQTPHSHTSNPVKFPDSSLEAAENFCRDPDGRGYPWCYTVDPNVEWESCGITNCSACSKPPTFANAKLVPNPWVVYYEGDVLEFSCVDGYIAKDMANTITCQSDGIWTSMSCHPIRSCSEVHQCNGVYSDNEYWIYPRAFGANRTRIYCGNLTTENAAEFITLPVPNVGIFPNVYNYWCSHEHVGRANSRQLPGETKYNKIKVNVTSMVIDRKDSTFIDQVFGYLRPYGEAEDCYTPHWNNKLRCGLKGTFNLNLQGTGLKLDPEVKFKTAGWRGMGNYTWNEDRTKVDLKCGGWAGRCVPDGPLSLALNKVEEPSEDSAITPRCVYTSPNSV